VATDHVLVVDHRIGGLERPLREGEHRIAGVTAISCTNAAMIGSTSSGCFL